MYLKSEFRQFASGMEDMLLWLHAVEPGCLELTDGALMAGWTYEGPDIDSLSETEALHRDRQLAGVLNLGSGWMIETDCIRHDVSSYYPQADSAFAVANLIDHERRQAFLAPSTYYASKYYLTLTYLAPPEKAQRLTTWLSGQKREKTSDAENIRLARLRLEQFNNVINQFENGFGSLFKCRRLKPESGDEKMLRYLRDCVRGVDHPFRPPTHPTYLQGHFAADLTPGEEPVLDGKHLRVISVDRYPIGTPNEPQGSYPGIFHALEMLPFAYRWHTRTMTLDPQVSKRMHQKQAQAWASAKTGLWKQMTGIGSSRVDKNALELEEIATAAMTDAGRGIIQFGHYDAKLILLEKNKDVLQQNALLAEKAFQVVGFGTRWETHNAIDAWRGSLPGHGYSDLRCVAVHTENVAHMMPQSTPYCGTPYNPSPNMPPKTPPLFRAVSDGATPYDFQPHVGETSHTSCFGPNRHGKSVLNGFIIAQWLARYKDAQVYAFDKHSAVKTLIQALQGDYVPFGSPQQPSLCPLANLDTPQDQSWACWYVGLLCENNGTLITPELRNCISTTIREMASGRRRSLTEFHARCRNAILQKTLEYYTHASTASGGILDGETDTLALSRIACFEMEHLLHSDRRILKAVMPYLFRRIEAKLDTRRPTIIPIDEAWTFLNDPAFADYFKIWFKELSKRNAGMYLYTQNLSDVMKSPLKEIIVNQCFTRNFLPSPTAQTIDRDYYRDLLVTDEQITMIAEGRGKQDYFHHVHQPPTVFFRRFQLNLHGVALAFIGANNDEERAEIARLQHQHQDTWPSCWLRHRGLAEWAEMLEEQGAMRACA